MQLNCMGYRKEYIYILVRVVNAFKYMQQLLIFEVRQMFNGKKHIFTYTFVIRMLCLIWAQNVISLIHESMYKINLKCVASLF